MRTYKVKIVETLERVVEVTANNRDEAMEKVEDMINCEDIVLDADDFVNRDYFIDKIPEQ